MSRELVLRPEAEADALEAYRWYNERVPGLGEEFLAELDREAVDFFDVPEHREAILIERTASVLLLSAADQRRLVRH